MDKKFRLVSVLSLVLCGLAIAWNTLAKFLGGVGLNYVAVLAIFGIVFVLVIEDKDLYYKTKDLFYVDLGVTSFETLIFIMQEYFGGLKKVFSIFAIVQKIFSIFAILYFAYIVLRILFKMQGKLGNVFYCLFHREHNKQPKKAKELSNGSLSEKPVSYPEDMPVLEGQIEIDDEDDSEE